MTKLAFVAPWFGTGIPGGAEAECRETARKLHEAGYPVEILTTCVREFHSDWSRNHHRPGVEDWGGIPVRRFKVQKRDVRTFDQINHRLMNGRPISPEEEEVFIREMLRCDDLIAFIRANRDQYIFIHIPYMFTTSYLGTLAAPDRTLLIPCLHDESYAYLGIYRTMFEQARGLIFNAKAEQVLADKLFRLREGTGIVLGAGIDTEFQSQPARFKEKYRLNNYLLYAGRKDEGKNVPLLVDYFCRYKRLYPSDLQLVMVGSGQVPIPEEHQHEVIDLGFVSAQDKYDAYGGAVALCQPSRNESFSIVMMEAWVAGSPVLVHEECEVTRDHCLASNGGLFFASFSDFVGTVDYLLQNPAQRQRMAENGKRYVMANYAWDRMVEKYRATLEGWGISF